MNKFLSYLGAIGTTILLAYFVGNIAGSFGVPNFIIGIVSFLMGWLIPGIIMQWIYKPETQASETQEHE